MKHKNFYNTDMTRTVDMIIGFGWIVFWAYWIILAIKTRQPRQPKSTSGRFIRLALVILTILVAILLPNFWRQAHSSSYLQVIGLVLFAIGLLVATWSRVCLGSSWGFPGDQRRDTELITSGLYRFIRHPIYTGILLAMLGTGTALTWQWLIIMLAFAAYFIPSSVAEEKYIAQIFPKAYPAYARKNKKFIPFIF